MLIMCHQIKIGTNWLQQVASVAVYSGVESLSDTCTLTLPDSVLDGVIGFEASIKRGDEVSVSLGYNDTFHREFTGYVKAVRNTLPVQIECEDASFLLRKSIKDKVFKKTTVLDILKYVLEQINAQLADNQKLKLVTDLRGLQYDKFSITGANGYMVLEKVRDQFGVAIYCRGQELHCHLLYTQKRGDVTYDFSKNVEAKSSLEYVRAEDRKVHIKVIGGRGKGKDNRKNTEVEAGETGGDSLTYRRPEVSDKKSLQAIARQALKKQTYDGYKGTIRGWLLPVCEVGYTAHVTDPEFPARRGNYYVKSVKTEFSNAGGVRSVELGIKLSVTPNLSQPKADELDYE